jgi:hypothetical protein
MQTIAAVTFLSGMIVVAVMYETLPGIHATVPVDEPEQLEPSKL